MSFPSGLGTPRRRGGQVVFPAVRARGRLVAPRRGLGPLRPFRRSTWVARLRLSADPRTARARLSGLALATFTGRSGRACLRITMATRTRGAPTGTLKVIGGTGAAARLAGGGRFRLVLAQRHAPTRRPARRDRGQAASTATALLATAVMQSKHGHPEGGDDGDATGPGSRRDAVHQRAGRRDTRAVHRTAGVPRHRSDVHRLPRRVPGADRPAGRRVRAGPRLRHRRRDARDRRARRVRRHRDRGRPEPGLHRRRTAARHRGRRRRACRVRRRRRARARSARRELRRRRGPHPDQPRPRPARGARRGRARDPPGRRRGRSSTATTRR